MRVAGTELPGVLVVEPRVFKDERGYFFESYRLASYQANGIAPQFVQDNESFSRGGVLRGLHYQLGRPQAKLVRVMQGSVFDVAVDIRQGSPTFGGWVGVTLSADNLRQFYIPADFAHGFCVLSESALLAYKCSDYYASETERGIRWDDPALGIEWPVSEPVVSEKDAALPLLQDAELPQYAGPAE